MKNDSRASPADLCELFRYNRRTGVLRWRVSPSNNTPVGSIAGGIGIRGYVVIRYRGVTYYAHRIAWAHVTGKWPKGDIDHINGVRWDNRFTNLRNASRAINIQNQRSATKRNGSTGLLGASFNRKTGKFVAQICVNYKRCYLGQYQTAAAAHQAYIAAKRNLHQGNTL